MTNQIDQIKQAEQEAEEIVKAAHAEIKKKTTEVRSAGQEAITQSSTRLTKEIAAIEKKTTESIKDAQVKIETEAKQEVAKLDQVKQVDIDKAVDLIVTQATK